MSKGASMAALLTGVVLLAPVAPALGVSSEPASGDAAGGSQVVDPDELMDSITNPDPGTDGSATIELPPIYIPDGDAGGDYSPPESDEDGADQAPSSGDDSQN